MKVITCLAAAMAVSSGALFYAQEKADNAAEAPPAQKGLVFNTEAFRPRIVLHEMPRTTSAAFVTLSGVIFSRSAIDRVEVGNRTAVLRQAEPKDLVKIDRAPEGASDAPYRTYFEVPDAGLPRLGANDLTVRAFATDSRHSDLHRITVVRTAK
ncbi:MAG: hypothetical protein U0V87_13395 [Acidobacteriota bacterium]